MVANFLSVPRIEFYFSHGCPVFPDLAVTSQEYALQWPDRSR